MTKPAPEFDTEKRRRFFAVVMGCMNATVTMTILLFQNGVDADTTLPVYAGVWILITILTFVATYSLWWKEYNSNFKSIVLGTLAIALTTFGLSSISPLTYGPYNLYGLRDAWEIFIDVHIDLYGLPYLGAVLVSWFFARPAPDARDQF